MLYTKEIVRQEEISDLLHDIFKPEEHPNLDFCHIKHFLGDEQGCLYVGEAENQETTNELMHKFFDTLFANEEIAKSKKVIVGLLYSSNEEVFLTDIAFLNEVFDKFDSDAEISWRAEQTNDVDGIKIYVIVPVIN